MEQITVALSPFTRRSRSFGVRHNDHVLGYGLEPGEHLLVHDPATDEHFCAVVADVDFEIDDTVYRVELGGRITAEEAGERLAPVSDDGRLTTRDLVDLLSQLRRGERDINAALAHLRAR